MLKDVPPNPLQDLQFSLTTPNTVDINSIIVDDVLWGKLSNPVTSIYTKDAMLSYTINDLVNGNIYVFRIGAVTQNALGNKIIGYMQNFTDVSPYLLHPVVIGKTPNIINLTDFTNGNSCVNIKWSSNDMFNDEKITNFIVEYRIYNSDINTKIIVKYLYNICIAQQDNNLQKINFEISIKGLYNIVESRPNPKSHSYDITIYAENNVGYTNEGDRVNLNMFFDDVKNTKYDIYGVDKQIRYIRPSSVPNII